MKIYLIDTGPGDAGLMTLKGRRALQIANCVVYDQTVSDAVLSLIPANTRRVKIRTDENAAGQQEIYERLCAEAKKGSIVVRLRGNDPIFSGSGAPEVQALLSEGIPCEVVPGVPAALASAYYAGIAPAHQDVSDALCIVNSRAGDEQPRLDFSALAKLNATLAFSLDEIALETAVERLKDMPQDTPVSIIEGGTTARQNRIDGTLGTILGIAAGREKKSAILIVGAPAAPENTLDWTSSLPLFGKRILIAQSSAKPTKLTALLRDAGAEAIELSLLKVKRLNPPTPDFSLYSCLAFSNPMAVTNFFEWMCNKRLDVRRIGDAKIAAMGAATADALNAFGLTVDVQPRSLSAEELADGVGRILPLGKQLLLVRALGSASLLPAALEARGIPYGELPVYQSEPIQQETNWDYDWVVFAAPTVVQAFTMATAARPRAICMGAATADAARQSGFDVRTAENTSIDALIALMKD